MATFISEGRNSSFDTNFAKSAKSFVNSNLQLPNTFPFSSSQTNVFALLLLTPAKRSNTRIYSKIRLFGIEQLKESTSTVICSSPKSPKHTITSLHDLMDRAISEAVKTPARLSSTFAHISSANSYSLLNMAKFFSLSVIT